MNNEKLEKTIIEEIEKSMVPVNTEFIAKKVGISWGRASRLLLALAVRDEVAAIPTVSGFIYMSAKRVKVAVFKDGAPTPEAKNEKSPP